MTTSKFFTSLGVGDLKIDYFEGLFILALLVCFFTYTITRAMWEIKVREYSFLDPKVPPTIPYVLPFLGSFLSLALNPKRFFHEST